MDDYMDMYNRRASFNSIARAPAPLKRTRQIIYEMIDGNSSVLDYGCGNGSLGYIGDDPGPRKIRVYGYDMDANNKLAEYHDLAEIGDRKFDYVLLSHILEHCDLDAVRAILAWCRSHGRKIIITLPNSGDNLFVNFHLDITHVKPYNNLDFLYVLERAGFTVDAVYRSELEQNLAWYSTIARVLFAMATQTSPFIHYTIAATAREGQK